MTLSAIVRRGHQGRGHQHQGHGHHGRGHQHQGRGHQGRGHQVARKTRARTPGSARDEGKDTR